MKVGLNGKAISSCIECNERRNNAGPVGFVCMANGDMKTPAEGFPRWCPLEDVESKDVTDEELLADFLERGVITQHVYDDAMSSFAAEKLPPRPWRPVYMDDAKAYLLDNDGDMIILYTHKVEYEDVVMPLFEYAIGMLELLKNILAWHKKGADTMALPNIIEDIEAMVRNAEGSDE